MLGNSARYQLRHRLAHQRDAQPRQHPRQAAPLARLDAVQQVLRRLLAHPLQLQQLVQFQPVQVRHRLHQPRLHQLRRQRIAQPLDVHAVAPGERLHPLLDRGRAVLAVRAEHLALPPHRRRAASGTFRRELVRLFAALAQLRQRPHHIGDDLAALHHDHHVADADVLLLDLVGVVQAGPRHRRLRQRHRVQQRRRHQHAVLADADFHVLEPRHRLLGLELERRQPARRLARLARAACAGRSRSPSRPGRPCRNPGRAACSSQLWQ